MEVRMESVAVFYSIPIESLFRLSKIKTPLSTIQTSFFFSKLQVMFSCSTLYISWPGCGSTSAPELSKNRDICFFAQS